MSEENKSSMVDCKRLWAFMAKRPDTLAVRGRHSLQSTSRIVIQMTIRMVIEIYIHSLHSNFDIFEDSQVPPAKPGA